MDRELFINEMFEFYGKSQDDALKRAYNVALSTSKRIDWQKLYMQCLKDSETRYLPSPKWFISKMQNCILYDTPTQIKNGTIRVIRNDDRFTDYVISAGENILNLETIKKCFKSVGVKQILLFDETVTFCGARFYPNDYKPQVLYEGV